MKKRITVIALLCVLFLGISAGAVQTRAQRVMPQLEFEGSTAYCSVSAYEAGKYIDITLELWRGNTMLTSWSDSGDSYAAISETYEVESGKSYNLRVSGTIGGEAIPAISIYKKCP